LQSSSSTPSQAPQTQTNIQPQAQDELEFIIPHGEGGGEQQFQLTQASSMDLQQMANAGLVQLRPYQPVSKKNHFAIFTGAFTLFIRIYHKLLKRWFPHPLPFPLPLPTLWGTLLFSILFSYLPPPPPPLHKKKGEK
jgi:hypothetical protein